MSGPYFLLIDPYLKTPAESAINTILEIYSNLGRELDFPLPTIQFFFPSVSNIGLEGFLTSLSSRGMYPISVISLGSYANLTDSVEWVTKFGIDLKSNIIEKGIPFLGICFSHQLFAHVYGSGVGYLRNPPQDAEGKKFHRFRSIEILHPRLKNFYSNSQEIIGHARHEQEVYNINLNELELACTAKDSPFEGLIHRKFPALSIQSHIETFHESNTGYKFIGAFLRSTLTSIHSNSYPF